jgi:flagellar hook-associated protein 2
MSTVGLAFGSPTAGTGFDVTSTVNQIVANLQAVETPWQNQLASLQSQDTALTGLGSDLSSLSTALQSLTDFQGVLAGKQGSSSDTSILQLTSSATNAVAGSHTIVVNSLAQTSSYYSNDVGATDTLSGTLSLQVGNGTAQTITIDSSDNTLSSLANAINSGSYGVTASVLTDASGSRLELVSNTSGSSGNITLGGSLTDATTSTAMSFTQAQAGADAQLTVDGIALTSASNTVTNALPGVTFQLLSAAPGTQVQVQITNDNTSVESAVNSLVTAYNKVITDLNTQESNDSSGTAQPLFGNPTVATLQQELESAINFAQPANAVGTASTIGSTDTLSGSLAISVGGGTAQTVNVNSSNPTLQGMADAINAAGLGVTASVITSGTQATLSLVNATGGSSGSIAVTSSLTDTTTGSAVTFGSSQANSVTSFTQLGISVNNDGTLTLNTDTLDALLNSNYQSVVNFLQPSGSYTSFGSNLTNVLGNLGNSTPQGAISLALKENQTVEQQLNTNITNENTIINQQKATLTTELNQANQILQSIPEQLAQVNEMYSAITGYNQYRMGS